MTTNPIPYIDLTPTPSSPKRARKDSSKLKENKTSAKPVIPSKRKAIEIDGVDDDNTQKEGPGSATAIVKLGKPAIVAVMDHFEKVALRMLQDNLKLADKDIATKQLAITEANANFNLAQENSKSLRLQLDILEKQLDLTEKELEVLKLSDTGVGKPKAKKAAKN